MGIIYKATNLVNGKIYIGQTIRDFQTRQNEHILQSKNNHRSCAYFHSAILKYGNSNFIWETIFESDNTEELNIKEIEFIKQYNSFGNNGYNLCNGGHSNSGYKHSKETIEKRKLFRHTEESKQKARDRMLGTTIADETKEKIRKHNIGKKASDETKAKMSINGIGKGTKYIKCIDNGLMYSSITECALSIGVAVGTLSQAIKDNKKVKGLFYIKITKDEYESSTIV